MSADLALDLLPTNYVSSSGFLRLGQESLRYRNFEWGLAAVRITQGNINCWRILITIIGSPWLPATGHEDHCVKCNRQQDRESDS